VNKAVAYYRLTKPGVLYGNVLTAIAGFFLASAGRYDWWILVAMTIGMTLVVGGACALNNHYDRDIDVKMTRTKRRPSVTGDVSSRGNVLFAWLLFLIGTVVLAVWTNWLTVVIGIVGFVTYVWLYGRWSKRTSVHGTAIGAVSGALPMAGGYAAVSGRIDVGLIIAFLIIFFWQFPEFYSISIYRLKEYKAAKIPLMSVVYGVRSTIIQIFIYTTLYVIATLLLTTFSYTGWVYFFVMLLAGVYWVYMAAQGLKTKDADRWSRQMFKTAMWQILLLCLMVSIGPVLP